MSGYHQTTTTSYRFGWVTTSRCRQNESDHFPQQSTRIIDVKFGGDLHKMVLGMESPCHNLEQIRDAAECTK